MTPHDENIKQIQKIADEIGFNGLKEIVNEVIFLDKKEKQAKCDHRFVLSQIAGDGYTCNKCGKWESED